MTGNRPGGGGVPGPTLRIKLNAQVGLEGVGPVVVLSLGAVFFGIAVGYITYQILARPAEKTVVSDLTIILSVIGGAAVTGLFNSGNGDLFGWYAIGLVIGLAGFFALHLALNGPAGTIRVMGLPPRTFFTRQRRPDQAASQPAGSDGPGDSSASQ